MRLSTKLAAVLTLVIGALALAACGDDDDSGEATASESTSGAPVAATTVEGTEVLADADGRTLYTADVEEDGMILCTGPCTDFWDPALGSAADAEAASDAAGAEIGLVDRPDGERQLALDGVPLYTFTDEGPGELTGDGFVDDFENTTFTWSVASAPGAAADSGSEAPDDSGSGLPGY
jgi:predicted lipoprotein with Yx(FWY)xxD motif